MIVAILGGVLGIFFVAPNSHLRSSPAQPSNEKGCLLCHAGIETINMRMQPFLLAFAQQQYGKREGYECAVCHEGNPSSDTRGVAARDQDLSLFWNGEIG